MQCKMYEKRNLIYSVTERCMYRSEEVKRDLRDDLSRKLCVEIVSRKLCFQSSRNRNACCKITCVSSEPPQSPANHRRLQKIDTVHRRSTTAFSFLTTSSKHYHHVFLLSPPVNTHNHQSLRHQSSPRRYRHPHGLTYISRSNPLISLSLCFGLPFLLSSFLHSLSFISFSQNACEWSGK